MRSWKKKLLLDVWREWAKGWHFLCHFMGFNAQTLEGAARDWWQNLHTRILKQIRVQNADAPRPAEFHPRATTVVKSSSEEHKQSRPPPPLMKPDHDNEPLWLTSLRHNKQCFDMVLNIPFPPTHTLTNKHCTPLCQAQQASCDGALLASYLPAWRKQ